MAQLSMEDIAVHVLAAGFTGEDAAEAVAVAWAESTGDSNARNPSSGTRGLWQIHPYWHREVVDACAYDPACAAREVFRISNRGRDWSEWATWPEAAAEHLPAARRAVDAAARSMGDDWGQHGEHWNMVTINVQGVRVTVNRIARVRFTGFLTDLMNVHNYRPKVIYGYNDRLIAGSTTWSNHAYGAALDIDPEQNPFTTMGMHTIPDDIVPTCRKWGIGWGGEWTGAKDYMHFEIIGAPASTAAAYADGDPKSELETGAPPTSDDYTVTPKLLLNSPDADGFYAQTDTYYLCAYNDDTAIIEWVQDNGNGEFRYLQALRFDDNSGRIQPGPKFIRKNASAGDVIGSSAARTYMRTVGDILAVVDVENGDLEAYAVDPTTLEIKFIYSEAVPLRTNQFVNEKGAGIRLVAWDDHTVLLLAYRHYIDFENVKGGQAVFARWTGQSWAFGGVSQAYVDVDTGAGGLGSQSFMTLEMLEPGTALTGDHLAGRYVLITGSWPSAPTITRANATLHTWGKEPEEVFPRTDGPGLIRVAEMEPGTLTPKGSEGPNSPTWRKWDDYYVPLSLRDGVVVEGEPVLIQRSVQTHDYIGWEMMLGSMKNGDVFATGVPNNAEQGPAQQRGNIHTWLVGTDRYWVNATDAYTSDWYRSATSTGRVHFTAWRTYGPGSSGFSASETGFTTLELSRLRRGGPSTSWMGNHVGGETALQTDDGDASYIEVWNPNRSSTETNDAADPDTFLLDIPIVELPERATFQWLYLDLWMGRIDLTKTPELVVSVVEFGNGEGALSTKTLWRKAYVDDYPDERFLGIRESPYAPFKDPMVPEPNTSPVSIAVTSGFFEEGAQPGKSRWALEIAGYPRGNGRNSPHLTAARITKAQLRVQWRRDLPPGEPGDQLYAQAFAIPTIPVQTHPGKSITGEQTGEGRRFAGASKV